MPSGQEKPASEMGFLLTTSPTTPNERSDEEKLKTTYFAQTGSLTFSADGASKLLELKNQGKKLQFKLQMMKCEFDAQLVTPFNASPGSLKGTIVFPLLLAVRQRLDRLDATHRQRESADRDQHGDARGARR